MRYKTKLAAVRSSTVGIFLFRPPGIAQSGNLSDIVIDRAFGHMDDEYPFGHSLSGTIQNGFKTGTKSNSSR